MQLHCITLLVETHLSVGVTTQGLLAMALYSTETPPTFNVEVVAAVAVEVTTTRDSHSLLMIGSSIRVINARSLTLNNEVATMPDSTGSNSMVGLNPSQMLASTMRLSSNLGLVQTASH